MSQAVESIDPANGETFETYEVFDDAQIDAALVAAHAALRCWCSVAWGGRAEL